MSEPRVAEGGAHISRTGTDKSIPYADGGVNPPNIPQELRDVARWVVWKYKQRPGETNKTKPPYQALDPSVHASVDKPDTWASYEAAEDAWANTEDVDGVGFVLTDDDDIAAVDLDNCIDDDGRLSPEAAEVVSLLDTYTEVSPSGRGLRLIARGYLPSAVKRDQIELYDKDRYVTITGNVYGEPKPVASRGKELASLYAAKVNTQNGHAGTLPPSPPESASPPLLPDDELLDRIFKSKRGERLRRLWDGDNSDYENDASAADMALMNALAWWSDYHPEQAERLFRRSHRVREKLDKRHYSDGRTYLDGLIAKTFAGKRPGEGYSGGGREAESQAESQAPSNERKQRVPGRKVLEVVQLSTVKPQGVGFLWEPYLVWGKVNNLQGAGGQAKTSIALSIAACITKGKPLPVTGEAAGPPGNVLYLGLEDDIADTLLPRFMASGGDTRKFFALKRAVVIDKDGKKHPAPLSLADTDTLRMAIKKLRPRLLIIDPVTSFLGSGVDMHRANEVRPVLEELKRITEKYEVTVLNILHTNKSGSGAAMYRALGTVDFGNLARSVLLTGEHDGRLVLTHAKINVAEKGRSLYYSMSPSDLVIEGRTISVLRWDGYADVTAEEVAEGARKGGGGRSPNVPDDEIADFILKTLESGPMLAPKLNKQVIDVLGAGKHTYQRVRAELRKVEDGPRIRYKSFGFERGKKEHWYYRPDLGEPDWVAVTGNHMARPPEFEVDE